VPIPLFLDLEVLQHDAPPWVLRDETDFKAPSNWKDPEKIRAHIQRKVDEQEAKLRSQSSLMPNGPLLGGTVAAVGGALGDGPVRVLTAATGDEAGELAMLQQLQAGLTAQDPAGVVLVTFEGMPGGYDLPFLIKRCLRHGLFGLTRWLRQVRHVDVRRIWQGGDRDALGRLTDLARWLGIPVHDTTRGSDVQSLWEQGNAREVGAHAEHDVVLLREIYWWYRAAGLIDGDDEVPERVPRAPDANGTGTAQAQPAPPQPAAAAPAVPARAALEAEVERLERGLGEAAEDVRRELDIGLRVPLGNLAEPDLLTRYRDALVAVGPAPLVAPSGTQAPGLPVLEDNMALYHRAVAAGWDPTPFARPDGQLEDRWLAAALLHLGTHLRQAYSFWTGEPAPGFRSTRTWHEDLARRVYEARLACATGELAWVAPTPVPDEVDVTILVGEGASSYVLAGRCVAGPDVDRSAVQGRVLRQPGQPGCTAAPAQPVPE
jgi:hypothetical protein